VELRGFEPLAFSLRTRRATNCATAPDADETITPAPVATENGTEPTHGARMVRPTSGRARSGQVSTDQVSTDQVRVARITVSPVSTWRISTDAICATGREDTPTGCMILSGRAVQSRSSVARPARSTTQIA
jgi:hypothetical protein